MGGRPLHTKSQAAGCSVVVWRTLQSRLTWGPEHRPKGIQTLKETLLIVIRKSDLSGS